VPEAGLNSASYSVAEARDHLTRLLRLVEAGGHVHIMRRGRPVAVLLSQRAFESLSSGGGGLAAALARFDKSRHARAAVMDDEFLRNLRSQEPGREESR
jgi:prevent-host-death family protein